MRGKLAALALMATVALAFGQGQGKEDPAAAYVAKALELWERVASAYGSVSGYGPCDVAAGKLPGPTLVVLENAQDAQEAISWVRRELDRAFAAESPDGYTPRAEVLFAEGRIVLQEGEFLFLLQSTAPSGDAPVGVLILYPRDGGCFAVKRLEGAELITRYLELALPRGE